MALFWNRNKLLSEIACHLEQPIFCGIKLFVLSPGAENLGEI